MITSYVTPYRMGGYVGTGEGQYWSPLDRAPSSLGGCGCAGRRGALSGAIDELSPGAKLAAGGLLLVGAFVLLRVIGGTKP
jgi:hypothetical protein